MKLFVAILLSFNLLISPVYAVTQGTDEVTINKPTDNDSISGVYEISWLMKDPEIDDPAYILDIYNLSCSQNGGNLGRVTNSGANKSADTYTYSWDTSKGQTALSMRDGSNYCLRVCGIMANGGGVYSLCDKKSFVFSKASSGGNGQPEIADTNTTFEIDLNDSFSHTVNAVDPDGDKLTYSFVNAISFLSIDTSTGRIIGTPTEVGEIKFTIKVDDGKGGIDTKEYTLAVGMQAGASAIEFTNPSEDSVITPTENEISWTVRDEVQVSSVVLGYSRDKQEWVEITRMDRNTGNYVWNISDLESGQYYLRLQITDQDNNLHEAVSDEFTLTSTEVDTTQITNLTPAEGSTVDQNGNFEISANFTTPEDVTIDINAVKFTLDGREDLTVCEVSQTGIVCQVVGQLTSGSHTVSLNVKDSTEATQLKEWSFVVGTSDSGQSTLSANTVQLILIVFAIGFVLIVLPWTLYLFLKRKKNKKPQSKIEDGGGQSIPEGINLPGENPTNTTTPETTISHSETPVVSEQVLTQDQPVNTPEVPVEVALPQNVNPQIGEQTIPAENLSPVNAVEPETVQVANQTPYTPIVESTSPSGDLGANPTEMPAMYNQEEIPSWMNVDTAQVQTENSSGAPANEILTKTEITEGSRVYDPYGLALNPDENTDQS